jgi:hypothetical protein
MVKKIARASALVAIVLAMITVRVLWSSRSEWSAAQSTAGDDRIARLGRAARLYTPGNPYARRALDALATEGRNNGPHALAAWREARSAILATRSFYTPHPELLAEANAQIAQRMAALEPDSRGSEPERRAWHAARLAQDDAPSVPWTLLALIGLFAWIGCAAAFFTRAIGEDDRLLRRPAMIYAAGILLGLICFFVGLSRA